MSKDIYEYNLKAIGQDYVLLGQWMSLTGANRWLERYRRNNQQDHSAKALLFYIVKRLKCNETEERGNGVQEQ